MKCRSFVGVRAAEGLAAAAAAAAQKLSYASGATVYFLPHFLPFAG